jgi:hypothetical protein
MSRRIINVGGSFLSTLNIADILGDQYLWDWDFGDNSQLDIDGVRINSVASKGLNSGSFAASGGARPQVDIFKDIQCADFDGVSEFMDIANSTGLFNFLHNATGGFVIMIWVEKNLSTSSRILNNRGTGGVETASGFQFSYINNIEAVIAAVLAGANQTVLRLESDGSTITQNDWAKAIIQTEPSKATLNERGELILNETSFKNNTDNDNFVDVNAGYNFTLGRRVRLNDVYMNGKVARIIVGDGILSEEQKTKINTFISENYGTIPR